MSVSANRMPWNLNTIVLLPLLRAIPGAGGVSVVGTLVAMTGLDFGLLGLGHPETAADDLVAWMMSFSAALPVCWLYYIGVHVRQWSTLRRAAPQPERPAPAPRVDPAESRSEG